MNWACLAWSREGFEVRMGQLKSSSPVSKERLLGRMSQGFLQQCMEGDHKMEEGILAGCKEIFFHFEEYQAVEQLPQRGCAVSILERI